MLKTQSAISTKSWQLTRTNLHQDHTLGTCLDLWHFLTVSSHSDFSTSDAEKGTTDEKPCISLHMSLMNGTEGGWMRWVTFFPPHLLPPQLSLRLSLAEGGWETVVNVDMKNI